MCCASLPPWLIGGCTSVHACFVETGACLVDFIYAATAWWVWHRGCNSAQGDHTCTTHTHTTQSRGYPGTRARIARPSPRGICICTYASLHAWLVSPRGTSLSLPTKAGGDGRLPEKACRGARRASILASATGQRRVDRTRQRTKRQHGDGDDGPVAAACGSCCRPCTNGGR